MLLVKMECKNVATEKLAEILSDYTEPCFRVWLYNNRTYAIFRLSSISFLKNLTEKFRDLRIKFNFYRIEEVSEP